MQGQVLSFNERLECSCRNVALLCWVCTPGGSGGLARLAAGARLGVAPIAGTVFVDLIARCDIQRPPLVAVGNGSDSAAETMAHRLRCPSHERRSCLVMLTSGTTAPPKGVPRDNQQGLASPATLFPQTPWRILPSRRPRLFD